MNTASMPAHARTATAAPAPSPTLAFRPAAPSPYLRLAVVGPPGSGKTYAALSLATRLARVRRPAGRVALIGTEYGKSQRLAGAATPEGFTFDAMELSHHAPGAFADAVRAAAAAGYMAVVVDSLSHAWMGAGGLLEMADQLTRRYGDRQTAWMEVTPVHRAMMEAILTAPLHVICTLRTKIDYAPAAAWLEPGAAPATPVRQSLGPVQREGLEYDFDVAAMMTPAHDLVVTNSTCSTLDGRTFTAGELSDVGDQLAAWLDTSTAPVAPPASAVSQALAEEDAARAPAPAPPPILATIDGMTAKEAAARAEIHPALLEASTEKDVEALRKLAAEAMPTDPGDPTKRVPSPVYRKWYNDAVRAAMMRVNRHA